MIASLDSRTQEKQGFRKMWEGFSKYLFLNMILRFCILKLKGMCKKKFPSLIFKKNSDRIDLYWNSLSLPKVKPSLFILYCLCAAGIFGIVRSRFFLFRHVYTPVRGKTYYRCMRYWHNYFYSLSFEVSIRLLQNITT